IMFIGDIRRNVYSSRALSDSMIKFAHASNEMKDSWKRVNVILDKFTLAMGTIGSKILSYAGQKIFDPLASVADHMMGNFAKMGWKMQAAISALSPFAG